MIEEEVVEEVFGKRAGASPCSVGAGSLEGALNVVLSAGVPCPAFGAARALLERPEPHVQG